MPVLFRIAQVAIFVGVTLNSFSQTISISCPTPDVKLIDSQGNTISSQVSLENGEALVRAEKNGYRTTHTLIKGPFKSSGDSYEIDALEKFPDSQDLNHFFSPGSLNFDLDAGDMEYRVFNTPEKEKKNPNKNLLEFLPFDSFEKEQEGTSLRLEDLCRRMNLSAKVSGESELFTDYTSSLEISATVERLNYVAYYDDSRGIMELDILWKISDSFGKTIFEEKYTGKSNMMPAGYVVVFAFKRTADGLIDILPVSIFEDAIEQSAFSLFTDDKLKNVLNARRNSILESGKAETLILSAPRQDIITDIRLSSVTIKRKESHGSGCIISSDGYVVTNYHVSGEDPSDTIWVELSDGKKYTASIIRTDPSYDLALLKIEASSLIYVKPERKSALSIGDPVLAVGTPANTFLGQTVTRGVISAFRESMGKKFIQTDANVSPGNSGGALLTTDGKLIGIVSLKSYGMAVEGVGFAIPSEVIYNRLNIDYK